MLGSIALLDACVLYPAPLRDFLLRLAYAELYSPRWSNDIHEEWIGNLLTNRTDLSAERLARTRGQMDAAFPQALVSGYETQIETIPLPDPDDRHVVAAAIQAKADCIVTFNLKDFPASSLTQFRLQAIHPDRFTEAIYHAFPEDMVRIVREHRAKLKNPPKSAADYLDTLRQNQLIRTIDLLAQHIDQL